MIKILSNAGAKIVRCIPGMILPSQAQFPGVEYSHEILPMYAKISILLGETH